MSKDYREYLGFIEELRQVGIVDRSDIAYHLSEQFEYLAEDEVSIILSDLL